MKSFSGENDIYLVFKESDSKLHLHKMRPVSVLYNSKNS